VAFCEIDPFCRKVLAKHWPDVPIYEDVRNVTGERLAADGIAVDVITGGFPCQDISTAGKGAGIDGERSGLWSEYSRIISEIRPKFVIVENVSALLGRGISKVLGDLAQIWYDAEWHCIPASAVGAPHIRDRVWIIAYPQHPDTNSKRPHRANQYEQGNTQPLDQQKCISGPLGKVLANANNINVQGKQSCLINPQKRSRQVEGQAGSLSAIPRGFWEIESDVGRVADGVPCRVDRLKSLGNAVVPQIPELIGRAILEAEGV
jgi:DNA (cytosine-5)-methyltransferase 1